MIRVDRELSLMRAPDGMSDGARVERPKRQVLTNSRHRNALEHSGS